MSNIQMLRWTAVNFDTTNTLSHLLIQSVRQCTSPAFAGPVLYRPQYAYILRSLASGGDGVSVVDDVGVLTDSSAVRRR